MSLQRFKIDGYATLEINHAIFNRVGNIISQTPLGEEFTKDAPCENGMWVVADRSRGFMGAYTEDGIDFPMGIVYTAEKEYDVFHYGLKHFGRKVAGDYPRVGIMGVGDVFTSNCFQYDTDEFADEETLIAALKAVDETPIYVCSVKNSCVPKVTKGNPLSGCYGKVVKLYTIPNGEPGIKYTIVNV